MWAPTGPTIPGTTTAMAGGPGGGGCGGRSSITWDPTGEHDMTDAALRKTAIRLARLPPVLAGSAAPVLAFLLADTERAPAVSMDSGTAWFAAPAAGEALLVDGETARITERRNLQEVSPTGIRVEQHGASGIVVDPGAGALTRVDPRVAEPAGSHQRPGGADQKLDLVVAGSELWLITGDTVQHL